MVSQNNSEFKQGISTKVLAHPHKRADGTNTLYLRVTIDRKKREFNLKEYWPADKFDQVKEKALPRHAKDKDVEGVNMVIDEAKARASRIKLRYFTDRKMLTLDTFGQEFENYENRDNFLFFWMEKQNQVFNTGKILRSTYVRHNTNLERLKGFLSGKSFLPMSDITPDFVSRYKQWLTNKKSSQDIENKKKLSHNTVVNALKCLKTYVNYAREDGAISVDPFRKTTMRYRSGERQSLEISELKELKALLLNENLNPVEREVLRKFLFSCYTGLRISDSAQIHRKMIAQNYLTVALYKGRTLGKTVSIPLPDFANELIAGRKGMLFESIADQTCNDWLKVIAHKAGIEKNLTFHVSRDTFATLFIEMGGDVFTLKELLGHSSIQTTQIYVKMSEKRKENLMNNFNKL